MSESGQSVFISYAREDLAAARRIADALSAFEVEVWFDEEGLEGGDAWDQKIRQQIKECSLFIPIISVQTQARREAYFRLEWKLAEERTHLMAEGTAFLLPIAIDEIPEAAALVPPSFLRTQWIRLPRGVPNTQFVDRVRALLETQRRTSAPTAVAAPVAATGAVRSWKKWSWAVAAAGATIIAARFYGPKGNSGPAAVPPAPPPAVVPAADRSLAVLPFINMSDDKDSGYFADGVHEDLLTHLTKIAALKVISRTSVMQYRDTKKNISQIGRELGVAYVLEGSVRRAGNQIRVTGQLIRAASDDHLWAQAYDGDLSDIFALQTKLATKIADELQAVLTPQEKSLIAVRPTANPEAYSLYLQARNLRITRPTFSADNEAAIQQLLERAVQRDPSFAQAWADLSHLHIVRYFNHKGNATAELEEAKAALNRVTALTPDSPEEHLALGEYYYYGFRDYTKASEQYVRLLALVPGHAGGHYALGVLARRQNRWHEALDHFRRAHELDPRNNEIGRSLGITYEASRYFREALAVILKLQQVAPDDVVFAEARAEMQDWIEGTDKAVPDWFASLPPETRHSPRVRAMEKDWAWRGGDARRVVQLLEGGLPETEQATWLTARELATALIVIGEKERARSLAEETVKRLDTMIAANPQNGDAWVNLGLGLALLGRYQEAIAAVDRAVSLQPEAEDHTNGPSIRRYRAVVLAWAGRKDEALKEIARLVRTPFGIQVEDLAASLDWAPLHGDPRLEAIIRDPANRAPKF